MKFNGDYLTDATLHCYGYINVLVHVDEKTEAMHAVDNECYYSHKLMLYNAQIQNYIRSIGVSCICCLCPLFLCDKHLLPFRDCIDLLILFIFSFFYKFSFFSFLSFLFFTLWELQGHVLLNPGLSILLQCLIWFLKMLVVVMFNHYVCNQICFWRYFLTVTCLNFFFISP